MRCPLAKPIFLLKLLRELYFFLNHFPVKQFCSFTQSVLTSLTDFIPSGLHFELPNHEQLFHGVFVIASIVYNQAASL